MPLPLDSSVISNATTPAPPASSRLVVSQKATAPVPAPISTAPKRLPKMARAIGRSTDTAMNRKIASDSRSRSPLAWEDFLPGGGSCSPAINLPICVIPALSPPA